MSWREIVIRSNILRCLAKGAINMFCDQKMLSLYLLRLCLKKINKSLIWNDLKTKKDVDAMLHI